MPLKQSLHVTDKIRKELCQYKKDHPNVTQKNLQQWLEEKHNLKVTQSIISNTLHRIAELLNIDKVSESSRRQKMVTYPLMETALLEWVHTYQTKINITGDLMKEKGAFFLNKVYPDAKLFDFSNGWLKRFEQRHGIKSFRHFGESGTVDVQAVEDVIPSLKNVLDQYDWKDIYNMDETGLFYRIQDDNSLATKQLEGRKQHKERMIVVVCTMEMACTYTIGSLGELQNQINLGNTTVHYLPTNMISKLQPCDAGIIHIIKAYYRRRFTRKLLERLEANTPYPEKIDILEAIRMVVATWTLDVKPQSIANCFLHCKSCIVPPEQVVMEKDNDTQVIIQELKDLIQNMQYFIRIQ
ncbi:CENP-B homolog protein 2-like [Apium graveolens]|uniref:CENP-B homolog protein 2-like n=1 Tax=Apium graveolens TaxID=4045 RepID=UPI003D7AFC62